MNVGRIGPSATDVGLPVTLLRMGNPSASDGTDYRFVGEPVAICGVFGESANPSYNLARRLAHLLNGAPVRGRKTGKLLFGRHLHIESKKFVPKGNAVKAYCSWIRKNSGC